MDNQMAHKHPEVRSAQSAHNRDCPPSPTNRLSFRNLRLICIQITLSRRGPVKGFISLPGPGPMMLSVPQSLPSRWADGTEAAGHTHLLPFLTPGSHSVLCLWLCSFRSTVEMETEYVTFEIGFFTQHDSRQIHPSFCDVDFLSISSKAKGDLQKSQNLLASPLTGQVCITKGFCSCLDLGYIKYSHGSHWWGLFLRALVFQRSDLGICTALGVGTCDDSCQLGLQCGSNDKVLCG